MKFTIALGQIDPILGDVERNIEKHLQYCELARSAGANVIVFPELSLTGYSVQDLNWELAINLKRNASQLASLIDMSKDISILAGGIEEGNDFSLYNSAMFFENRTVRSVHRKIYLPTYGMFEEGRQFSAGHAVRSFDTRLGRIGALICEDLWHMSLPYLLAMDGARAIIGLVASPTRMSGDEQLLHTAEVSSENQKAYARLLSTYIVFCNRVGYEDGVNFWGGSSIVGPSGELLAMGKLFDEDLVLAVIDEDEIRRARRFSRHFLDERLDILEQEIQRLRMKR